MQTAFDCALNGVLLSGLDSRICVLDLRQDAPKLLTSQAFAEDSALRVKRDSLKLHVDFVLHEEDPIRRRALLDAVHAWAVTGGLLTVSDRPGQQLAVICTGLAAMSAEDWTQKLTLTFRSARAPYWEDAEATTVTGTGQMALVLPGTAESTPVDAELVHHGASAVTDVLVLSGDTFVRFEWLAWLPESVFRVFHRDGALHAQVDGESVLPCRTANSADMLLARCGTDNTVQAIADSPLTATFTARGRYV